MRIRNTIKNIGTLCLLPYIVSCSFTADVGSIIDKSINGSGSRIELVKNGIATSDREDAAVLRVYALTSEGASVQGFTPSLKIIGDGSNISECGPISGGYAECSVISDAAGEKIVTVENLPIEKSAQALFTEPSSNVQVTKLNDNALANGTDSITFEFLIKNSAGQLQTGVHPHGQLVGTSKGIVNCTPSNSEGKAFCRIRSFEAGSFRLASSLLTATPLTFSFLQPKVTTTQPRVDAGSSATIKIATPGSLPPELRSIPDPDPDFSYTCQAPVNGYATCTVSSSSVGTKVIEVTSPTGINDRIEIVFADLANSVSPSPNNPEKIKADDSSPYEFIVDVGAGNAGVVPVIDVVGSGDNQVTCQPSDANGKSVCKLTSNAPGEKEIIVKSPPTKETIKVTFEAASIIKDNPSLADGISPVKIYVPMAMAVGDKAEVSVSQAPDGAETKVVCAPAVMSDELGIAQSLCLVTADTTGEYKVAVTSPKAEVLDISFADVKSSFKFESASTSTAIAGNGEVRVLVNLKNPFGVPRSGETPVLKVTGSGTHTVDCSATDSSGNSICTVTNSTAGLKYISVASPLIKGQLVAQFTIPGVDFIGSVGTKSLQLQAVTHPKSFAVLPLTIGQNLQGVVPVLSASGSGNVKSFCEPTNNEGKAVCYVQGEQAGLVSVGILEPSSAAKTDVTIESNVRNCAVPVPHATLAKEIWSGQDTNTVNSWGQCVVQACEANYNIASNMCEAATRTCDPKPTGSNIAQQTWNSDSDQSWGRCKIQSCKTNYTLNGGETYGNSCEADTASCADKGVALPSNASAGQTTWQGTAWGTCKATACNYPYKVASGSCAAADVMPNIPLGFNDQFDVGLSSLITSNEIEIQGIEIPVPISVTGGIGAYIETSRGPSNWVNRNQSYSDLQNGDYVRIVTTSSSQVTTPTVVTVKIGNAPGSVVNHNWTVTTVNRLSPSNPVLTHVPNSKDFKVAWGAGGAGNDSCKLQYRKNGSDWTDIAGFSQNCDIALAETNVTLPTDEVNGWTNNFASGVDVRLVMASGGGQILTFAEKLTCNVSVPLPLSDSNSSVDANCNGKWSDDFDDAAPAGGSFVIAATDTATGGSSTLTASLNVNLNITCPEDQASPVKYFASESATKPGTGSFVACSSSVPFTLSGGDGEKTIHMWFKDNNDNITENSVTQKIFLDRAAPIGGNFTLASLTTSLSNNLTVTCPAEADVEMAYGLSAIVSNWAPCAASASVTLADADGSQAVYLRFRDKLGNVTAAVQKNIILDRLAPASGSFLITQGDWTNSQTVNLDLTCATDLNGPVVMAVQNSSTPVPSTWEACVDKTHELTAGDGEKNVYVWFKDAAGNISASSTDIVKLDMTAPITGAVGNPTADQMSLTIPVTVIPGTDGSGIGLGSNNSDYLLEVSSATLTGSDCGTFGSYVDAGVTETPAAESYNFTATEGKCYKFQYKVKDALGNQATFEGPSITKVFPDTVAPVGGNFTISAQDTATGGTSSLTASRDIDLNITCPTDQSAPVTYAVSESGTTPAVGSFVSCTASAGFNLSTGDGTKTVYMWFKDGKNNISSSVSRSITLDQTAPSGGNFTLASLTTSLSNTLTVTCPAETDVQMAYGLSAGVSNWTACATSPSVSLNDADGTQTVYMKFRDKLGNVTTNVQKNITLDRAAPTGGSFVIAEGANTKNSSINLDITCASDANGVEVAYGVTSTPVNWEACADKTWSLTGGDGSKTLYVRFKDNAGNISAASSKSILLDTTAPTGGSVTNSTADQTLTTITVPVSRGSDAGAGLSATNTDYILEVASATLTGTTCGTFGAYADAGVSETATATSYNYTATPGKCYKFQYKVKDVVGNQSVFGGTNVTKVFAPANMVASSSSVTGMNVTGPGNPAYGSNQTITFTNNGGVAATLGATAVSLSNTTNFEVVSATCTNNLSVAAGSSCNVVVRPKATADGALSGTLTLNWNSSL